MMKKKKKICLNNKKKHLFCINIQFLTIFLVNAQNLGVIIYPRAGGVKKKFIYLDNRLIDLLAYEIYKVEYLDLIG